MHLHPQLRKDCFIVGQFNLCALLLMNESRYPWFILVPQRDNVREICELTISDQHKLIDESSSLADAMRAVFSPDKLNIAAIGNIVPQLHVHHVARFQSDAAWPKPVWGLYAPESYGAGQRNDVATKIAAQLAHSRQGFVRESTPAQ